MDQVGFSWRTSPRAACLSTPHVPLSPADRCHPSHSGMCQGWGHSGSRSSLCYSPDLLALLQNTLHILG